MTKQEMIKELIDDFDYVSEDFEGLNKSEVEKVYDFEKSAIDDDGLDDIVDEDESISDEEFNDFYSKLTMGELKTFENEGAIKFNPKTLSESQARLYAKTGILGELVPNNFTIINKELILKKIK